MNYRDRDAFNALIALLQDSREFARVSLGPASDPVGSDLLPRPSARVIPDGWSEAPDTTANSLIRTVDYRLAITVEHPEPAARFRDVDRLSALVQNLLDGSTLGDNCLAGLTKLTRGRFPSGNAHAALTVELQGRFAYSIPTLAARVPTL